MTKRGASGPQGIFVAGPQVYRLYATGTVLDVLVKPEPGPDEGESLASWLRPGRRLRGIHETTYRSAGNRISFAGEDHFTGDAVEVTGIWRPAELVLDLHSSRLFQRQVHFRRIWPVGRAPAR